MDPLEKDLLCLAFDFKPSSSAVCDLAFDLEDVGIKTIRDAISYIDFEADYPYKKLQSLVRCRKSTMIEFVERLRKVADVPVFDQQKERDETVDVDKVLEDYRTVKALRLFDDEYIREAIMGKYRISKSRLEQLLAEPKSSLDKQIEDVGSVVSKEKNQHTDLGR